MGTLTKAYYDKIKKYIKDNGEDEVIQEIVNLTITEGKVLNIYKLASLITGKSNIKKLESAMLETKDVYYICRFAADIQGANVVKCQETIEKIGDLQGLIYFAKEVKGANVDKIRNIIKESKDEKQIQIFAEEIDGAIVEPRI